MTHADFLGYCTQYDALITRYGDANIGIPASVLADFRQKLSEFTDCCNATTASALTTEIQAADERRIRYYRGIRSKLANLQYSTRTAVKALLAKVQKLIVNVYGADVASESQNERNAHIKGLLRDLSKFTSDEQATLGIADDIPALTSANEAFISLSVDRVDEQSRRTKAAAATLRSQLTEALEVMYATTEYWSNVTESVIADSDVFIANAPQMLAAVNALTAQVRNTARTDTGTTSGSTAGSTSGSTESGSSEETASGTESGSTESGNNGTTDSESTSGSTESSNENDNQNGNGSGSSENTESGSSSESTNNSGTSDNTNTGGTDDGGDDDDDVFA